MTWNKVILALRLPFPLLMAAIAAHTGQLAEAWDSPVHEHTVNLAAAKKLTAPPIGWSDSKKSQPHI